MKKQEAVNTFSEGLILDLNPLSMPNNALTNCLNGTLLTFNGNENMLQNDMGNCRIETAMLPTGYIPLGSTSFGGIIYIVSYNPIDKKYQIGSFPSPERNLTKDELGDLGNTVINMNGFCDSSNDNSGDGGWFTNQDNIITKYYQKVELTKDPIYPGDKYKIFLRAPDSNQPNIYSEIIPYLSAYDVFNVDYKTEEYPKYLKLSIIAILDDGRTIDLTNNSVWTKYNKGEDEDEDKNKEDKIPYYYIYLGDITNSDGTINLSEYRGLVGSNYDTYSSKLSGKLGIAARLEVPTSFSIGYDVLVPELNRKSNNVEKVYQFYFYLNWANDNEGIHKNRVNPAGIKCLIQNQEWEKPIELMSNKARIISISPDAMNNEDYYTIVAPDNYYKDDSVFISYLQEGKNRFDTTKYRANDGTDFQYLMVGPRINKVNDGNGNYSWILRQDGMQDIDLGDSDILNFTITPYMPFGQLKFLERTLQINMSKLQSGEINFLNYQYYVEDKEVTMDFFIEAYPELGKSIRSAELRLYPFKDYKDDKDGKGNNIWIKQDTYNSNTGEQRGSFKEKDAVCSLDGPISGFKNMTFERKNLNPNTIYIAEFKLQYGDNDYRYFYRLFFNSNLFNNAYNTGKDFKDLYLYDSDQNYGLIPTFNFSKSTSSEYDDSYVVKFPEYLEQRGTKKFVEEYRVSHNIESFFTIGTNLGDELLLDGKITSNLENSVELEESSDEDLIIQINNYPDKCELGTVEEDGIVKNILTLENKFSVKIPYNVEYSKANSLEQYALQPLKEGANNYKIIFQHHAKNKNEGKFTMFVNASGGVNDEGNIIEQYECPDKSQNVSFSIGAIESMLKEIMNRHNYDQITVLFGISKMWDKNCGYGFKEFGDLTSERFFKLQSSPANYFLKMTCVRKDDTVVLAHKKNSQLSHARNITNNKDDNDKCTSYRSYNELIKSTEVNDGTVIPVNIDKSTSYVNSVFKKYTKIDDKKLLYFIESIDSPINPSIDVVYNIKLAIDNPMISIGQVQIKQPEKPEELACNLRINSLKDFNAQVRINTFIDNEDFVNNYLMLDSIERGWDKENSKVLLQEHLSSVFDDNLNIVEDLSVKDQKVCLSESFSNSCLLTQWYFGWEDTGGTVGTQISQNSFQESDQWYKVLYTYAAPNMEAPVPINTALEYQLSCASDSFTKEQPYNIDIERILTPDNFEPSTIAILCEGGETQESFEDLAQQEFKTSIQVVPKENTCKITLIFDNEEVGTYTLENVSDPDNLI